MQTNQIVIVDQTGSIDPVLLHAAAESINIQVTQQLSKVWGGINASVSASQSLSAVQNDAWPVFLVTSLPEPGELGVHLDDNNQPYAKVVASAGDSSWTIDASHEIVEMLVDPFGNRAKSSRSITIVDGVVVDGNDTFMYLVEACDPCEANGFGYEIQGIAVSDFITPNYYDATSTPGTLYSFRGNITRPREMLKGGYISFANAVGTWQQILWLDTASPVLVDVRLDGARRSLREWVHDAMPPKDTAAKHVQRRKHGGLPALVQSRVSFYDQRRADVREREIALTRRYKL